MRTASQAILAANQTKTNRPGMCQNQTWNWYQSHSVGDVDHDGDADAVDGWKSEPKSARFTDRLPMVGAPCAWSGGSGGFGHRAICVGYSRDGEPMIRSTDAGGRGKVSTKPLSWFEKNWHLKWLGWSKTISGVPIEGLRVGENSPRPKPKPKPKPSRGTKIENALKEARAAKAVKGSTRATRIKAAIKALEAVPFLKK